MTGDSYHELGRRLLAAVESHRLGLGSLDHTLKNRIPEEVDSSSGQARARPGCHSERPDRKGRSA